MKKAIVSVTNDLATDQRVHRTCMTLVKTGFDVTLTGRKLPASLPLAPRTYRTRRTWLLFNKGPLFYAEYNIRLFLYLLFRKKDLLVSNDLDTLLANRLASKIFFHGTHIHDCHEYFRGVPELVNRPRTARIWKFIEDCIFPKLPVVYAVNGSVAKLYHDEYGNDVKVIRNVPFRKAGNPPFDKTTLGIRPEEQVILYQGAVNVDRGLEEVIDAMAFVKSPARLVIIGTGDIIGNLRKYTNEKGLSEKVIFTGPVPMEELHIYTSIADVGISIEKDIGVNYHFALPNKFLDYIQAEIPVLVSPFPEMMAIVEQYRIGELLESHDPQRLAAQFDRMLTDREKRSMWKNNLATAAVELCWENEEPKLIAILRPYA